MPDVQINGHRLDYALTPPARTDAPTIVFLHEGLGCLQSWRGFPERLAAHTGCGTLTYSRWGYGRSAPRPGPWSASYLHEEARETLPAILATFQIEQPVLYGHSDGGSIALIAAAHASGFVRAVITEAAHVVVETVSVAGVAGLRARYDTGDLRQRLERHHGANTNTMFDGWTQTWLAPSFRTWDLRPLLPDVRCPVLALQGDADEYGTPAQVEAIAAGVGGPVETWIVEHCGHAPHREHTSAVAARTAAFVRPTPGDTTGHVADASAGSPRTSRTRATS